MNYQGNIDAYYSYANENRKTKGIFKKNILTWLLLLLFIGFLIWAYFKIVNKGLLGTEMSNITQLEPTKSESTERIKSVMKERSTKIKAEAPPSEKPSIETPNMKIPSSLKVNAKKLPVQKPTNEVLSQPSRELPTKTTAILATTPSSVLNALPLKEANSSTAKVTVATQNLKSLEKNSTLSQIVRTENNSTLSHTITADKTVESNLTKTVKNEPVEPTVPVILYHLYVVQKGETLYDIAKKQFNDASMYKEIIKANPDYENPNAIKAGDEILLPIVDESKSYAQILHFK